MNKLRLFLTITTIIIVLVPLLGTLLAHQGNLLGLFVSPQITAIADSLTGGDDGPGLEQPTIVGEPQYDEASHTFTVTFQYKNSLPMDITIKSLAGNVECAKHHFPLGPFSLNEPVSIDVGKTAAMTVIGTWTDEAINHFANLHGDQELVDVVLADFALDISGIQVQMDGGQMGQTMQVPNPALMERNI